ncbi:hypothetical protein [Cellvibrio fibrivorans]|uniref:Uncharacterized protein n=1 Tax=Cellvibrio fibrivorans TaxID=126350 RepID=A0ABU1UZD2_9GAMM|nr:hypothetical protein [Cellvibrio fibrivorans]MDR7090558.1 hypothetical protein [Cellvibrio fibrivorans]
MSKVVVVFIFLIFSAFTFSEVDSKDSATPKNNELSEFEVMLEGMKTCSGFDLYYDKNLKRSIHPFFIGKTPSYIDDDYVVYDVEEYYYGMKVIKITIPNHFPVVDIEIDEDVESVKIKVGNLFVNGFYSAYPPDEDLDKPVVEKSRSDENRTNITCD